MPNPFFRFRLTADTLGFSCILPTAGRIGDFHPLERVPTGHTKKKPTPRYAKQAPSIICTQYAAAFSILVVVVLAAVAVAVLRAVLRTVSGAVLRIVLGIVLRTVPGAVLRAVLAVILLAVVS